jgi:large subunit ribosomal protein L6
MSRVGRKPIPFPKDVEVNTNGQTVSVKGPLGRLEWPLVQNLSIAVADGHVRVNRAGDEPKMRALHGLARAELSNMVIGVTKGYERTL